MPRMPVWTDLPFGKPLTDELKKLASDLDMD
jgi:hypothetical protein